MPIYEYRCGACGSKQEVLQKMSEAPLTDCPACGQPTLTKLVSAAGFQLKGSGWYVTDFKSGSKATAKPADKDAGKSKDDKSEPKAPGDKGEARSRGDQTDSKPKEDAKSGATRDASAATASE